MTNDNKFSLEEKRKIALEELSKVTGKEVANLSMDENLSSYFPETEDQSNDDALVGDPAKLEFMINLEMKVCKDVFRLNPEHFFDAEMTLNKFIDLIQEAEDKAIEQEYETVDDLAETSDAESSEEEEEEETEAEIEE